MARSKKKTPIISITTAPSDKSDKANANRRLRRNVRQQLKELEDDEIIDELLLPQLREVSNVWDFAKDGKKFLKNKDLDSHDKHLRK